jgi:CPA2 family monovalent cation:H+ antiporter-2
MMVVAAIADTATMLLQLGGVIVALAIVGRVAHALRLSPVPFYLVVGLLVSADGPGDIGAAEEFIEVGAQIGIVLLLLLLGLEYSADEFVGSMRSNARGGLLDLGLSFTPGFVAGVLLGWGALAAFVLGGITYISSSGIVAKLLGDLGRTGNRETPTVLSLLVIEDLVMAIYLPLLVSLLVGGSIASTTGSILGGLVAVGLVLVLALRYGATVSRWIFSRSDEVLLFTILGVTFVLAGVAETLHVSAAVGAFLVGIALSGPAADSARPLLEPLRDLFAGAFFVFFALEIELSELPAALPVALALAVVTSATKVVTGWWAARRAGIATRGRFRAGTTMVARGEFSIVIAGLAVSYQVDGELAALAACYVLILAFAGPVVTRFSDDFVALVDRKRKRNPEIA